MHTKSLPLPNFERAPLAVNSARVYDLCEERKKLAGFHKLHNRWNSRDMSTRPTVLERAFELTQSGRLPVDAVFTKGSGRRVTPTISSPAKGLIDHLRALMKAAPTGDS